MSNVPTLPMNDGHAIPQLGFGVFQIPQDETETAVTTALQEGYRLIDTAQGYQNEEGVGAALAASDVSRDEVFVTTKLWIHEPGEANARRALEQPLEHLGLDLVDAPVEHRDHGVPAVGQGVEDVVVGEREVAVGQQLVVHLVGQPQHHPHVGEPGLLLLVGEHRRPLPDE